MAVAPPAPVSPTAKTHEVQQLALQLKDAALPLPERFRALFSLRNLPCADGSAAALAECLNDHAEGATRDHTALLRHECAFCLGQMQAAESVQSLIQCLSDGAENSMVRHEAAEALGAIAATDGGASERALEAHVEDAATEVAETCQLALRRLRIFRDNADASEEDFAGGSAYKSVDPAPAARPSADGTPADDDELLARLTDEGQELWERYGALFALRNKGGDKAAVAVAAALAAKSAVLRHEAAYSLGQLQSEAAQQRLLEVLGDEGEHPMVRHEAAEALGSIASDVAEKALKSHADDKAPIVAQSCAVALDILEAERSGLDYVTVG